jgi:transposase
VRLDKSNGKPFKLTQAEYREASKLTYTMKKLGSHTEEFQKWMGGVMETLTNAPSKKSVLRYSEYLRALGSVWNRSWAYHARRKLQRIKFYAWRRREAWMTKLVSRIKQYAEGGPVLFGNGADSGLFGRLRGGGAKGPVLEIKKRLSEQMPVIEVSEFRTSKLCLICGRVAKTFNHSVTYCTERDHHRMANRDVAAAKKIGALYLAKKKGLNLGPWSRSVSAEEVNQGTCLSTVLQDVLYNYERGEYF